MGAVDTDGQEVDVLWRLDNLELFEQIDDIIADPEHSADTIQDLVTEALQTPRQVTIGQPFEGDEDGKVPWLVLRPKRVVTDDEETRQTWGGTTAVRLDVHSAAVAARAQSLARHLSLTDAEVAALELAGLHHDAGKRDRRFQIVLGRKSGDPSRPRAETHQVGVPSWRKHAPVCHPVGGMSNCRSSLHTTYFQTTTRISANLSCASSAQATAAAVADSRMVQKNLWTHRIPHRRRWRSSSSTVAAGKPSSRQRTDGTVRGHAPTTRRCCVQPTAQCQRRVVTDFVLGSDHTRALDHFAGYGLGALLEQAGEQDVRLHWSDEADSS